MAVQRAEQLAAPEMAAAQADVGPRPRLFDVDEYYRMAEVGILKPDERVELIEGEIVVMSPIGDRHAFTVNRLNVVLVERLGRAAFLSVQNPIRLAPRVEPQPDFAVSRPDSLRPRRYQGTHPRAEDILLVVEVADTSAAYDLGEKAEMYARHGVPELWVLDLPADRVVIHREPTPDGYASVQELRRGASVSPLAFADVSFSVDDLLGPPVSDEQPPEADDEAASTE